MSVPAEFTYFPEPRPAAMVISHERSGTHFLMNSLAACYGYVSLPWIDFDMPKQNVLEFHTRPEIRDILLGIAEKPMANVVKSHHTADFFTGELEALTKRYVIFVIYREPVGVMLSYWRFMYRFRDDEEAGPKSPDPLTFARSAPSGRMLRYQSRTCATILERWAANVESWLAAWPGLPNIRLVRYEDLNLRFEETMKSFAPLLGREPQSLGKPIRDHIVIPPGPDDPLKKGVVPDIEALRQYCLEHVGATMAKLGY